MRNENFKNVINSKPTTMFNSKLTLKLLKAMLILIGIAIIFGLLGFIMNCATASRMADIYQDQGYDSTAAWSMAWKPAGESIQQVLMLLIIAPFLMGFGVIVEAAAKYLSGNNQGSNMTFTPPTTPAATYRPTTPGKTISCPVCGEDIPEDTEVCPYCHENIKEFKR